MSYKKIGIKGNGMKSRWTLICVVLLFVCGSLPAHAANIIAIGEITAVGDVSISSSDGKWAVAPLSYPLLPQSGIRTGTGSAALYFKDGSRANFKNNTTVVIDSDGLGYSISLLKGVMLFNVNPGSSVSVITPNGSVVLGRTRDIVQKVSYKKLSRVAGAISVTDRGTEVKSISGEIIVKTLSSVGRPLSPGEVVVLGADNKAIVAQYIGADGNGSEGKVGEIAALKGRGSLIREQRRLDARLGEPLQMKDSVESGKDSRLKMRFLDGSLLTLGGSSKISVKEYLASNGKSRGSSVFNLVEGKLRTVVGKNKFEVRTSTMVAAARGTELIVWTLVIDGKPATGVLVLTGDVVVRNISELITALETVQQGFVSYIVEGSAPTTPVSVPSTLLNQLLEEFSGLPGETVISGVQAGQLSSQLAPYFIGGTFAAVTTVISVDSFKKVASPSGF